LIGGWVGTRAGLEAGRENIFPITDSTGNWIPIVQPLAQSL
jgi:hypothetical protein